MAQDALTGTIKGRVINNTNGRYLANVRVTVEGTSLVAVTDDFGEFLIRNVPVGEVLVRAAYSGQEPCAATVNVTAGKASVQNFGFGQAGTLSEDGTLILDEYVVQAKKYEDAAAIAIAQERASVNIKNVVAADAFGDVPGGNIGEFVKFLPGVMVNYGSSDTGANSGTADSDATGVSIRGMGAWETAVEIDGMPVSSAFPGNLMRQVYLDTLSIKNASRVELTKVPTPDMPSNSLGGTVNLVTKSAFEYSKPSYNWEVYLTANSEFLSLKKTPGPTDHDTYKLRPAASTSVVLPLSENLGVSFTASYVPEFKSNRRSQPSAWNIPSGNPEGSATPEEAAAYRQDQYRNRRLERWVITDTPQMTTRSSGNMRVDWRPFPGHSLSANLQYSTYGSEEAQRSLDYRTGTAQEWGSDYVIGQYGVNNTPSVKMTVTTRDRIGKTFSGSMNYKIQTSGWDIQAAAHKSVSNSEYQDADNGHFSEVTATIGGTSNGRVQVNFWDIVEGTPGRVEVLDMDGNAINTSSLSGWRFGDSVLLAKSGHSLSRDTVEVCRVDVRRELDFLPWSERIPMGIKVGYRRDMKHTQKWGRGSNYAEEPAPGASVAFDDVIDRVYVGQEPGWGHPAQEWLSTYNLYELNQRQNLFGVFTEGRKVANYDSYIGQNKSIKETKDAWYAMLDGRALGGRLGFVGGVRQGENKRVGVGPFTDNRWHSVKNADGTLYREGNPGDPYYNGVRFDRSSGLFTDAELRSRLDALGLIYPRVDDAMDETGTYVTGSGTGAPRMITGGNSGTLEARRLYRVANQPISQKSKGDPAWSMSVSYDLTESLQAKVAWSRSFGQPQLEDNAGSPGLVPNNGSYYTYSEFDGPDAHGKIGRFVVPNPTLGPSIATNWDASLGFYFMRGGSVSLSYYWKEVTNQQISYETEYGDPNYDLIMRAIGLDPVVNSDYYLKTSTNGDGLQRTSGWELSLKQNFGFLGTFGQHFDAFASFTKKNLGNAVPAKPIVVNIDGTDVTITPDAGTMITIAKSADTFAGAGISFSTKRLSVALRGTYRERNEYSRQSITYNQTGVGNVGLNYIRRFDPAETRIDLSMNYRISEKYSLFLTGRDIFNNSRYRYEEDDLGWIPSYAQRTSDRSWGVEYTVGIRGSF